MPDWQKSRESFRDFLHQYPLWTAIDMFLDSRWGRRALQLGIGAVVMGASSVVAFIEHASPLIKYGLGGFSLALVVIGTFEFAQFQADKRKAESAPESSDEIPTLEAQSALYRFDERSCPYLAFAPDVKIRRAIRFFWSSTAARFFCASKKCRSLTHGKVLRIPRLAESAFD